MASMDRFSRYLLGLDDESFFALVRNYLGPVQTPYNKHDLIGGLREFYTRPETQARIVEFLDGTDRVFLSGIHILSQPDEERLFRFLGDGLDYAAFHERLLNLKDRLLVIGGHPEGTLTINPVVADALAPEIGIRHLISGAPIESADILVTPTMSWLSPILALAMYSFLRTHHDLFTQTGTMRKKAARELEARFGRLFTDAEGTLRLRSVLVALETLGLIGREEGKTTLRHDSWDELARLPDRWIQALLWAALLASSVERTFDFAQILLEMAETMPADYSYSVTEVIRLLQLSGNGFSLPIGRDTVERLCEAGYLRRPAGRHTDDAEDAAVARQDRAERFGLNPTVTTAVRNESYGDHRIRIQANMEVTVTPGARFGDALAVARVAALHRFDVVAEFSLSEASVAAARRETHSDALSDLERVTGELPQNVRFLLSRWQTRSQAVRLLSGVVVVAREEEAAILNRSADFRGLLREELAPGVFLVDSDALKTVERLLERLDLVSAVTVEGNRPVDVDIPDFLRLHQHYQQPLLPLHTSRPRKIAEERRPVSADSQSAPHLRDQETDDSVERNSPLAAMKSNDDAASIVGRLRESLEKRAFSEDIHRELALRIDRKLILFPAQLRQELTPQRSTEARGLDYLGKVRLIEQALESADMLEVIMRSASGSPQRIMIQPREIVASGDDLMLRARQEPGERAIRIRIRRISLVRRLSGTLIRRTSRRR
ncbi:MAG: hypothetical protein MI724_03225 [Spirochaetales bacterium]|nr:hypothetical protein [Spirochaetales bacterium]